jgi:hypothetical protein
MPICTKSLLIFFQKQVLPCTRTNSSSPATIYADYVDLAFLFGSVKFHHCLRKANKVVHELARYYFLSRDSYNSNDDPLVFF